MSRISLEFLVLAVNFITLAILVWIVSRICYVFIRGIRGHFMSDVVPLTVKFGNWAVVTGSTDGIGKAYAFELAKRGINIVLISRNEKKLHAVSEEIAHTHLVQVKTIVADFSKGKEIYDDIEKELKNIQVGILVNNVGKQYDYPKYLTELDEQELWDIVNVNIGATTMMTRIVLPQMVKRKRGAIVNVSSGSELQPLPLMTVYAASKVFIKSFSESLRFEYRKSGITVQHLSPMFVNTKMNNFSFRLRKTSLLVPDATTYARHAVNTLGILDNSTGYWTHGIQYFLASIPPVWLRTYIGGTMNQIFRSDYYNGINPNLYREQESLQNFTGTIADLDVKKSS